MKIYLFFIYFLTGIRYLHAAAAAASNSDDDVITVVANNNTRLSDSELPSNRLMVTNWIAGAIDKLDIKSLRNRYEELRSEYELLRNSIYSCTNPIGGLHIIELANGRKFLFSDTRSHTGQRYSWASAKLACRGYNMALAKIDSTIRQNIKDYIATTVCSATVTSVTYWVASESLNSNSDSCVAYGFDNTASDFINVQNCINLLPFICEVKPECLPYTSSIKF